MTKDCRFIDHYNRLVSRVEKIRMKNDQCNWNIYIEASRKHDNSYLSFISMHTYLQLTTMKVIGNRWRAMITSDICNVQNHVEEAID